MEMVRPCFGKARWEFFGGKPRNWLERTIKRPAPAQWRACWESIRTARCQHAALVISHDAQVTFRVRAVLRGCREFRIPHVAWGFNFTTLPRAAHRRLMASTFTQVDRFITYSTMERSL